MKTPRPAFAYLFERFPSFVQTFCYREVEEMVRQQMDPLVVSIRRPEDPQEVAAALDAEVFYLPEEKALRAEVDRRRAEGKLPRAAHRAIPRHRNEPDSQRLFEAIWLAPELQRQGIRHVHAHFGGMAARTACWLKRLYGITFSFTGHANDIFCESGFPISNADLAAEAQAIVTETDYARRWMEEKHPAAKGKVFRVFNGIELKEFLPRKPAEDPPRILSVGRYVEKKGFDDLIRACEILRREGREFLCQIVGEGPLEAALRTQIAAADLGAVVQLLGPLSQTAVRTLLAEAHVFVLPCVVEADGGSDNLPTVVMEAMAAGVPAVSTTVAGVPEMITNGVEGLLVPPRDVASLAEAISRLLTNEELANRFGEQGAQTARAKFTIQSTTRSLKHLLATRTRTDVPESAWIVDPLLPRRGGWLRRLFRR